MWPGAEPSSLAEVETQMEQLDKRLLECIVEQKNHANNLLTATTEYEKKYLTVRLGLLDDAAVAGVKLTQTEADQRAKLAALDLHRDLIIAEILDRSVRSEMDAIKSSLSARQTRLKMLADEAGHGRYGRN